MFTERSQIAHFLVTSYSHDNSQWLSKPSHCNLQGVQVSYWSACTSKRDLHHEKIANEVKVTSLPLKCKRIWHLISLHCMTCDIISSYDWITLFSLCGKTCWTLNLLFDSCCLSFLPPVNVLSKVLHECVFRECPDRVSCLNTQTGLKRCISIQSVLFIHESRATFPLLLHIWESLFTVLWLPCANSEVTLYSSWATLRRTKGKKRRD